MPELMPVGHVFWDKTTQMWLRVVSHGVDSAGRPTETVEPTSMPPDCGGFREPVADCHGIRVVPTTSGYGPAVLIGLAVLSCAVVVTMRGEPVDAPIQRVPQAFAPAPVRYTPAMRALLEPPRHLTKREHRNKLP